MSFNDQRLLRDAEGTPIPQVYNATTDTFIPLTPAHFQYNESVRVANENQRQTNEQQRQTEFQDAMQDVDVAVDNANDAAINATTKATELENRVDTAIAETTDSAEIIDAREGVDGTDHPTLKDRLDVMQNDHVEQQQQTQTLQHGTQVINSDQASPLKVEFYGNTLVNLLGKIGNFETDSNSDGVADGWTKVVQGTGGNVSVVTSDVNYGMKSQKLTTSDTTSFYSTKVETTKKLDVGKSYLIAVDYLSESAKPRLAVYSDVVHQEKILNQDTSNGIIYLKFSPSESKEYKIGLYNIRTDGDTSSYVQFDGFRIYEIDQATYDAIGVTLTDADVERLFPYVDGIQSVKNPVLSVSGSNLLPPFSEWNLHANASVISPYELELDATGTFQQSYVKTPVVPNTTYTINIISNLNGRMYLQERDVNDNNLGILGTSESNKFTRTFTTSANCRYIQVILDNNTSTGTFTFSQPMLNLGTTAKPFVPKNDSALFAEVTLAGFGDKKDILSYSTSNNRWEKRKHFETDVVLDETLNWTFAQDYAGFKRVYAGVLESSNYSQSEGVVVKGDGTPLTTRKNNASWETDMAQIGGANSIVFISISDSDSGWAEDYTPTSQEIKDYFSNENYFLSYQLAEPVTEVEGIDFPYVEGDLSIQGDSQIELSEGVIVREEIIIPAPYNSVYYINDTNSFSEFNYKAKSLINIYEDGEIFDKYTIDKGASNSYGKFKVKVNESDLDTSKTYTVTYEVLDKYDFTANLNEVTAHFQNSIKSSFESATAKLSDQGTAISILDRQMLDVLIRLDAGGL